MDGKLGLTTGQAREKLKSFGLNVISDSVGVAWWKVLARQFKSSLMVVLMLAMLATYLIGDFKDTVVIGVAVLINITLGFFQEYRAEKAVEALRKLVSPKATVMRDGQWREVDVREVVPGDVVKLTIGQRIPADGVLIEEDGLFINEAILTGESVSVEKKNLLEKKSWKDVNWEKISDEYRGYMGTIVDKGIAEMLVVATGAKTRIGGIAKSVAGQEQIVTPLQKRLSKLSRQLTFLVAMVIVFILVLGRLQEQEWVELLPTAIALAVAAVPEGMLISLTVILAVGMKRILSRKSVVKNLMAAETLGSVDVICLDKTGTITEGKMRAVKAVTQNTGDKQMPEKLSWLIKGAILCNDARDPLEHAMEEWALKQLSDDEKQKGVNKEEILKKYERIDELPFDPKYRYIMTRHHDGKKVLEILSGAPEVVLQFSTEGSGEIKKWKERFKKAGEGGYRMVGFAIKEVKSIQKKKINRAEVKNFKFLGLILFEDPVRESVMESLSKAKMAGIDLKVITGDYKETAWAAMQRVGLVGEAEKLDLSRVILGEELDGMGVEEKKEKIKNAILFARTSPEQKLEIVDSLQSLGKVVAMMGDGVNDAPALKKADIGITVNEASDVARESAALVLLDNNFETIVAAIEEGRAIFGNLQKVIVFLLAGSLSELILMLGAMILGWPLPLLPVQILWINLVAEVLPTLSLAVEPKESDLLLRRPTKITANLIDGWMAVMMIFLSVLVGIIGLGMFGYYLHALGSSLAISRTLVFAWLSLSPLVYIFSIKALDKSIWRTRWWSNKWLLVAVMGAAALFLMVLYWPIASMIFDTLVLKRVDWLLIGFGSLILMVLLEIVKWFGNKHLR